MEQATSMHTHGTEALLMRLIGNLMERENCQNREILAHLVAIRKELSEMPTQEEFDIVINAINEATNRIDTALTGIVTRIEELKAQIGAMGLTSEQEAALKTALDGIASGVSAQADRAGVIASDPGNPVPPVQ